MSKKIEIGLRLKEFAKKEFGGIAGLERRLGKSPSYFQNYVNGRSFIGGEMLSELASIGLDINYLLTGEYALNPELLEKLELLDKRIEKLEASNYRLAEENRELKEENETKDQEIQVLRVRHAQIDEASKDKLMGKGKGS